jgi:hypothetical protein
MVYDRGVGIEPIYPSGTNSTMFTECCQVAICDDQPELPTMRPESDRMGFDVTRSAWSDPVAECNAVLEKGEAILRETSIEKVKGGKK